MGLRILERNLDLKVALTQNAFWNLEIFKRQLKIPKLAFENKNTQTEKNDHII